jgi:outer membrane protein assembly factor BamD
MRVRVLLLCLGLVACSETSSILRTTPTFFPTAQANYEFGLKELKAGNWLMAQQYFQHVRNNFGFSKWATLAELGMADADFGREKYIEAVDSYKQFSKAHPNHEKVQDGYVAFRIGESYHKQIPSDWFLAPPSYEKDQGPVIDALRELNQFVEQYSKSPYVPQARKLADDCVRRLTDHELFVARYYLSNNHPMATVGRLEGIVKDYPMAKRQPEILLLLGKTYLKMEKLPEARDTFQKLLAEHPDDYRADKAKMYLAHIDSRLARNASARKPVAPPLDHE